MLSEIVRFVLKPGIVITICEKTVLEKFREKETFMHHPGPLDLKFKLIFAR